MLMRWWQHLFARNAHPGLDTVPGLAPVSLCSSCPVFHGCYPEQPVVCVCWGRGVPQALVPLNSRAGIWPRHVASSVPPLLPWFTLVFGLNGRLSYQRQIPALLLCDLDFLDSSAFPQNLSSLGSPGSPFFSLTPTPLPTTSSPLLHLPGRSHCPSQHNRQVLGGGGTGQSTWPIGCAASGSGAFMKIPAHKGEGKAPCCLFAL